MYDPLRAKTKMILLTATAFLFGIGLAGGLGWTSSSHAMPGITEAPQVSSEQVRPARDLSDAFTNLADAVTPSVVRIETRRTVESSGGRNQEVPDAFRRFFDLPEEQREEQQDEESRPPQGRIAGGSGFIVSEDGYILTNNHVVAGADAIRVYLSDRRYFDAEVVGRDPFTDIAVIKIDAGEPLSPMSFGDSDGLRVGEWVLAIGNPGFGSSQQLDFTVTAGIVSARGRGLQLLQRDLFQNPDFGPEQSRWAIEDFIQTDAVINPGNSGGPMVNLDGQVVGINSAIASTTGVYQGYGFAIPVNLARRVMEDLIEYGHVQRPRIGVSIQDVAAEDAAVYDLPSISGVLVQTVDPEGPSAGALQPEDVIVALDGEPVGYVAELQAKIAERRPGDRVEVTVYRDGEPTDVTVRLDEAPIVTQPSAQSERVDASDTRLGIQVEPIDGEIAQATGFEVGSGVVLTEVARGSPAARRGVGTYRGNKLIRVGNTTIESPEELRAALDQAESGKIVSLQFEDPEGSRRVVNVRMP
ncbi:MAG: Do family serine endopeptidase [Gemmatimonadota bacterium]|nr:Do family serine endopeptidase [Gemmatimonadota bacterium]